MLVSPKQNGLTSSFKEIRVFKVIIVWSKKTTNTSHINIFLTTLRAQLS